MHSYYRLFDHWAGQSICSSIHRRTPRKDPKACLSHSLSRRSALSQRVYTPANLFSIDGLRDSHAKFASDTHPLLEPALLDIKAPLQRDVTPKSSRSSPGAPDHTAAHLFPTLSTLSPRGSAFSSASSQDDDDDLSCASSEGASVPVRRPRTRPLTPAQAPPVIPATYTDMHAWDGSYHDASHFAHSGTVGVDTLPSIEFFSPPHNTFDVAPMQHYMPQQQPFTTSKTIDPFATTWDAEFTTPAGEMSWNDLISSIYN
jgi:hypothetical protein